MLKSCVAAAAVLAVSGCIIVPIPIPVGGSGFADPQSIVVTPETTGFGAMLVAQRAQVGAGPVERNAQLTAAATDYARQMDEQGFFDHRAPNGSMPWDRAKAAGYCSSFVAENIAYGQRSETQVFNEWMQSKGHRENMMDARFVRYGLGNYGDKWVLLLGDACTF